MTWEDKPIGYYEPFTHDEENETCVVPIGELYWMVKTDDGCFYDTPSQDVAIILSNQYEIKELLKNKGVK